MGDGAMCHYWYECECERRETMRDDNPGRMIRTGYGDDDRRPPTRDECLKRIAELEREVAELKRRLEPNEDFGRLLDKLVGCVDVTGPQSPQAGRCWSACSDHESALRARAEKAERENRELRSMMEDALSDVDMYGNVNREFRHTVESWGASHAR